MEQGCLLAILKLPIDLLFFFDNDQFEQFEIDCGLPEKEMTYILLHFSTFPFIKICDTLPLIFAYQIKIENQNTKHMYLGILGGTHFWV